MSEPRKTRSGKIRDISEQPAKKEKDPNLPKRPLTTYFLYTQDKRDDFKKKHPEMKCKCYLLFV
jgi:high mobility group protein B3